VARHLDQFRGLDGLAIAGLKVESVKTGTRIHTGMVA
jgi:hypothetical protein